MKGLLVFVAVMLTVLPCWAVEPLVPVTCEQEDGDAAARLAMGHINEHHHHGYKFKLSKIQSSRVEQGESECKVLLELDLLETTCHTVNPKHFEDCELRDQGEGQVKADCNVTVTIKDGVANVAEYDCDTEKAMSAEKLVHLCPDCPTLLPLNDPEGLKAVQSAVERFNKNPANPRYYVLRDVGRISSGYMMMTGMNYYAEFALVETHCPMGSRIVIEACKPLCPDRAHHALCSTSSAISTGEFSDKCEIYEPLNSTDVEPEPMCHHHGHHHRPPPLARPGTPSLAGQAPHAHGHGHGPPPHAHPGPPHRAGLGPPPHAAGRRPSVQLPEAVNPPPGHAGMPPFHPLHPLHPLRPCHGAVQSDPAIHPICPWPHRHPNPRRPLFDEGTTISS